MTWQPALASPPATWVARGATAAATLLCGCRSKVMRLPLSSNRHARTLPERTSDKNSLYISCSRELFHGEAGSQHVIIL